jgi:hypothetical protein
MEPALNPFTPGSGKRPPALEGRVWELERLDLLVARSKARHYDRSMVLTGLRGVGKTVLLDKFATYAESKGWLSISVEARPGDAGMATIRSELGRQLLAGLRTYKRREGVRAAVVDPLLKMANAFTFGLSVGPATVQFQPGGEPAATGDIVLDLQELVHDVSHALKKDGSVLAFFVDEMQDIDRELLGALLAVQHQASRQDWAFYVFGAGLPSLPAVLSESRSYAERLFLYREIGPLDREAAAEALGVPVRQRGGDFTLEALDALLDASEGYPYALQEYGYEIWNGAPATPFTLDDAVAAVGAGRRNLDAGLFATRWAKTTDREQQYLRAMAESGEDSPRTAVVAERMGRTPASVTTVRDSLMRKGLVWAPEVGRVEFTVPGMGDFIRRQRRD